MSRDRYRRSETCSRPTGTLPLPPPSLPTLQGTCDTCDDEYHDAMQITKGGEQYTFDSFECPTQELAPECPTGGVRIVGHGTEHNGSVYCCSHCDDQA